MKRWFLIALMGLLVGGLCACQPATSPPFTPTATQPAIRLVTIEQKGGHYEVVVYDLNHDLTQLGRTVVTATDTEELQDVAWTEDGQNVVFVSFNRTQHISTLLVTKTDGSIISSFNCGGLCMYPTVNGEHMAYAVNSGSGCLGCGEWHLRNLMDNSDVTFFTGEIYDERAGIEYYWHGSNEFTIRFNLPISLANGGYKGNFLWSTYSLQNGTPELINTTDWEHRTTQPPSTSPYTLSSVCALEDPGPICGSAVISDNSGHRFAIDYIPIEFYVKSADIYAH